MFLNKLFTYLTCAYLKQLKVLIKIFKSIMKIGMDIVVMNLTCASLSVCHFPCSRAEGRFPVPYRFFIHVLTVDGI